MSEKEKNEGAEPIQIERGRITAARGGPMYKVASYTRKGVTSRWMEAQSKYTNELERDGHPYSVGDEVFYFQFGDGRGMIIGKMTRA